MKAAHVLSAATFSTLLLLPAAHAATLTYDVAWDLTTTAFQAGQGPGDPYIAQGYIYPGGFLTDPTSGVNSGGGPEFPDDAIGVWLSRGNFTPLGQGHASTSGVYAFTVHNLTFDDGSGLFTQGNELADIGTPWKRIVMGGTDAFAGVHGEVVMEVLATNASGARNFRMDFNVVSQTP